MAGLGSTSGSSGGVLSGGFTLAHGAGALGGSGSGCAGGAQRVKTRVGGAIKSLCPEEVAGQTGQAGATASLSLPSAPAATPFTPSAVPRPELNPIKPQANYDPEINNELAATRANTTALKAGTGFAQDVMTQQQRDAGESRMREAEQAAAQMGVPFDKAAFLAKQLQGENAAAGQVTLGREGLVTQSLGQEAGVAQNQAGERDTRLGVDLQAQNATEGNKLQEYGTDVQKYGVDANAATAANTALLDFYSKLASGAFGMMGSFGSPSTNLSSSNVYGSY